MKPDAWLDCGENAHEWRALVEAVELADFFQLRAIQLADSVLESHLVASLSDVLGERWQRFQQSQVIDLLTPTPLDADFRARLRQAKGWCVVAAGADVRSVARAAAILNQRRDVIREALDGPMLVALHPLDWRVVRLEAPDLWSVHTGVSRFVASPLPDPPRFPIERRLSPTSSRTAGPPDAPHTLEDVVRLVIQSDPGAERRRLLLDGLPVGFIYSLPTVSRPIDQLRFDLMALERTPRLVGLDRPPLRVWLDNAIALMGATPAAQALARYGNALFGDSRGNDISPDQTNAPSGQTDPVYALIDDAVDSAHSGRPPSVIRAALHAAMTAAEDHGDRRLIARLHARAGWIHGHFGDRRSGLAEVDEGRQVATPLSLDGGDEIITELDTVAHWLQIGA